MGKGIAGQDVRQACGNDYRKKSTCKDAHVPHSAYDIFFKIRVNFKENMMKKFKFLAALLVALFVHFPLFAQEQKDISFDDYLKSFDYKERKNMKIEIPEMLELYKQGAVQIIDIRFPEEYQAYNFGFIKSIPLNELPARLAELDKNKIIVTICPHYDRAEIARTYLTLKGYRSKYLVDGAIGLAEYLRGDKALDFINATKK
jgi:rhodanese-related sulfurtransferase